METVEAGELGKFKMLIGNLCDGLWVHAGKRRKSLRRKV